MAEHLQSDKKLKAVGLLGSDVYDKLELLKALRPLPPDAVFFTNNLDARFAHPEEWNETHNLVVVSAFDLEIPIEQPILVMQPKLNGQGLACRLPDDHGVHVPPFRDSYQTALFAATRRR